MAGLRRPQNSSIRNGAGRRCGAAFLIALATLVSSASATAGQPPCAADEGAEIPAGFGFRLCGGSASATIVTHAQPQRGARIVGAEGVAAEAGVRAGDVVYQVAGQRVESGEAAAKALAARRDQFTLVNIWRGRHPYLVRLWPAPPPRSPAVIR